MSCVLHQYLYAHAKAVLVLLVCFPVAIAQSIHVPTIASAPNAPPPAGLIEQPAGSLAAGDKVFLPTVKVDPKSIPAFFGANSSVSPLTQVGSAYNGASSSATVSANLVSLIVPGGWQGVVATNIQAGSSGETSVTQGTIPTLSAAAAGQATQNMLYGGTIAFAADFPLFYYNHNLTNAGGFAWELDLVSREGIDVQNFKAGTSTTVSAPPSHHATQLETYFLVNSLNPPPAGSTGFAGSLFIGGSYGYSYTSHGYARDYGFGNRVNNAIGQATAGIMITNVSKISVSRAFGPSQTYIDSTSLTQTKINNFKAWSFAITYQSAASKTP